MAAMGKGFAALFGLFACLWVTTGEELKPFMAWSNSDALSSIKTSESASEMIKAVAKVKNKLFVVFLAKELSFDEILKHGGVYGETEKGDFANLKSVLSSSKSQLWTGVSDSTRDIPATLASLLILDLNTIDGSDILNGRFDFSSRTGVIAVTMNNGLSFQDQDAVVGAVVKALGGVQYVAIYSRSDSLSQPPGQDTKQRSRREAMPELIRGRRAVGATEEGDSSDSCSVGGVLTYSNGTSNDTETPCLLFCIKSSIQRAYINLTINLDESESGMGANSTGSCLLKTPSNMSYCCQQDLNNPEVTECAGEEYPFVMVQYQGLSDDNATATNMTNLCSQGLFANITRLDGRDQTISNATVTLKFTFPNNYGNETNKYYNAWNVRIHPSLTYIGANIPTSTNLTYGRYPANQHLFEEFAVPQGLSYACGAKSFQMYLPEANNVTNSSMTDPLKSVFMLHNTSLNVGDIKEIILPLLQVQPYSVKSGEFSEAYNCVGYFTYDSMMGIFVVVVLLIILYLSLLCIFSMNTIDRFEDPRGQTITVEKLH